MRSDWVRPWAGKLALLAGLAAAMPARAQGPPPPAVAAKTVPVGTVADGQRAFDAGDFSKAHDIWIALAMQGEDAAAVALGGMLDQGIGIGRDSAAALGWYGVAAAHGVPIAEFDVGVMLDSGRGASRDVAQAATWYARAAAHGNRRAQYNLGQLYAAGEGVPLNPAVSRAWYSLAARNGIAAATTKLAPVAPLPTTAPPPRQLAPAPDLHQAAMQAPFADQAISARSAAAGVEFVWLAPAQPVPAIFFVEVAAVGAQGTRPAASRYVAQTAAVFDLGVGDYIWRVYVVDQRRQRYAASDWQRFSVMAPTAPHD